MANEILQAYEKVSTSDLTEYRKVRAGNPFIRDGKRRNSLYVGGTLMGDEGKGIVVAEQNREMVEQHGSVVSLRLNGGANAGHSGEIDGIYFVTNQFPTAVVQEGADAVITRGCVFNPRDGQMELDRITGLFGKLPGNLLIDERVPLCLDTHRALDSNKGSTGRGIGPASADFYNRRDVTAYDLLSPEWHRILGEHYDEKKQMLIAKLVGLGVGRVDDIAIRRLDNSFDRLGSKHDFLGKLAEDREMLKDFVLRNPEEYYRNVWKDETIPVTFEEAQAPGLDPYGGIRPDVTSTRIGVRYIHDATHGVMFGEDVSAVWGVTKTVYASVVGSPDKVLPGKMTDEEAQFYHEEMNEVGRTTGRKRDIYHMPLPLMRHFRKGAMWTGLVATHIDAARADVPVKYVSEITNKETGKEVEYAHYQDQLDRLEAHFGIELPGWDGREAAKVTRLEELDDNALRAIALLHESVAPVVVARNGGKVGDNIKRY